jgi:opacity protein-like surface antigen
MLATLAVLLFAMPRLQAQANAPQKYVYTPRVELFVGYTHFGTFSTNAATGNRMVGLNGGSTSLAFNFNRYLGLVGDFGGYDDSQLQLTGTGANQPLVVSASGTAYTYMGGPRLSYRNSTRFTPFAQALFGGVHASAVTVSNCTGTACTPLPSQNAFAMTAGAGLDISLTRHISLRAVQAEYMMTRFAALPSTGSSTSQNDLRLSTGLVFRFGDIHPPAPLLLACSVQPQSAFAGDPLTVTASATNLNPKRKVVYFWSTNGGVVSGTGSTASVNTAGLAPGSYVINGHAMQGSHAGQQANCTASFSIQTPAPPTVACSANPSSVNPGDTSAITAQAVSPQNHTLTYAYSATAGTVTGNTATATLATSGAAPGTITVTCNVVDDLGKSASATTDVTVLAPPPLAAPQTRDLCALSFDRDRKRPTRVDNEAKGCLDDIALTLQRESTARMVIVGNYGSDESPAAGATRSRNVRAYLTEEKGIDAARIDLGTGSNSGRSATNVLVPAGATYTGGSK